MHMKPLHPKNFALLPLVLSLGLAATPAWAQQPAAAAPAAWKYKTQRLSVAEVDALLARPGKVLVLDVRRPDEQIKYGSFPVFLSVQHKDLEQHLAFLPRDRIIITVSNHAGRAGAAGDLLASKGYTVAGAAGSEDYEKAGGKAVAHIQPPEATAAAPARAASATP
jgi:rhodanese-related sulfurtransferase